MLRTRSHWCLSNLVPVLLVCTCHAWPRIFICCRVHSPRAMLPLKSFVIYSACCPDCCCSLIHDLLAYFDDYILLTRALWGFSFVSFIAGLGPPALLSMSADQPPPFQMAETKPSPMRPCMLFAILVFIGLCTLAAILAVRLGPSRETSTDSNSGFSSK